MRETLRKHGIEAQPASEFNTREEGCWLLTDDQFAGMECRVVVVVGADLREANAFCRCTSYLIYVADLAAIQSFNVKKAMAVHFINPYPPSTYNHRKVQTYIKLH